MLRILSSQEFFQALDFANNSDPTKSVHIFDLRLRSNYTRGHVKNAINVSLPSALLRRPSFDIGKAFACLNGIIKITDLDDLSSLFIYDAAIAGLNRIHDFIRKFRRGGYSNSIYVLSTGFEEFAKSHPDMVDYDNPSQSIDFCMFDAVLPKQNNFLELLDPTPASTTLSPDYSFPLRVPIKIPTPVFSPSVTSSAFSECSNQLEYFASPTSLSPKPPHTEKPQTPQLTSTMNSMAPTVNDVPFVPISPSLSHNCPDPMTPVEKKPNPLSSSIPLKSPSSRPALRSLFSFPSSPRRRPSLLRSRSSSSSSYSGLASPQHTPGHPQISRKNSTNANLEKIANSVKIQSKDFSENNPRSSKKLLPKKSGSLRRKNKPSFGRDFEGAFSTVGNKNTFPNPWGSFKQATPPPAEMMADLNTASIFYKFSRLEELEQKRRILSNDAGSDWSCLASSKSFRLNSKNRYTDIVPYDRTRVLLPHKDENHNYINASHIVFDAAHYIASQAPQLDTLVDFWEMIWHNTGSDGVIVMLTDLFEAGNEKCVLYFPDDMHSLMQLTPTMSVELLEKVTLDDYRLECRTFCLRNSSEVKVVRHYWFRTWTDGECPGTLPKVIDAVKYINKVRNTGPVFVHCSAGVGRTGTYIALAQLVDIPPSMLPKVANLEDSQDLVFQVVNTLRCHRMKMVQTFNQFRFLYSVASYISDPSLNSGMCHNEGTA
ncbi:tyrosine phosphatase Pyp2 [Schizosaccharomyces octosporus yFS286]|uniref:protein-tyrosine-phosphatase n=1 Tax=Schizosaccharomyces octosporus (strain yFS286) TaxID=483514 RepID=S9PZA4_SCHOY|nr:tyrosine phosphatase Pyp2 [Schizosaccharomyces octosporus yFS286]EPX73302.1 tyrosine phosphatase Pyp2 [Schizosaccharomyces octosporus yFS286]